MHGSTSQVPTSTGPLVLIIGSTISKKEDKIRNIPKPPSPAIHYIKRNPLTSVLVKGISIPPKGIEDKTSGIDVILGAAALIQSSKNEQKH